MTSKMMSPSTNTEITLFLLVKPQKHTTKLANMNQINKNNHGWVLQHGAVQSYCITYIPESCDKDISLSSLWLFNPKVTVSVIAEFTCLPFETRFKLTRTGVEVGSVCKTWTCWVWTSGWIESTLKTCDWRGWTIWENLGDIWDCIWDIGVCREWRVCIIWESCEGSAITWTVFGYSFITCIVLVNWDGGGTTKGLA